MRDRLAGGREPLGLGALYDLSGGFALGLASLTLIALAILVGIVRLNRASTTGARAR